MIPLVAVSIFVGVVVLLRRWTSSTDITELISEEEPVKKAGDKLSVFKWFEKTTETVSGVPWGRLAVFIGFALIYGVFWMLAPKWWWENVVTSTFCWFILFCMTIFGLMHEERKRFLRYSLSNWGFAISIIAIVLHFSGDNWHWSKSSPAPQGAVVATASRTTKVQSKPVENLEAKVVEFFSRRIDDPFSAWVMVQICQEESGFRQFDKDGVTPLPGEDDPADTGICQLNKRELVVELAQAGFNIDTLEGNLEMSVWLYNKKKGFDYWVTKNEALKKIVTAGVKELELPVGVWTEIKVPGTRCQADQQTPVFARFDQGPETRLEPGDKLTGIGNVLYFRPADQMPGKAKVRCM